MKANNITEAAKVLILVATIIVVCVLCAIGFKMTNEGKSAVNSSTSNLNNMTGQYQDIDKAIYDGATVQGSEVVNLIKKILNSEEYLAIRVSTKANTNRDYNYAFTAAGESSAASLGTKTTNALSTSKSDSFYINPNASFSGKVYKDANSIIICIEFVQQ
jgi:LPS O-antigen subunit length determinant protein (WzzB/FepE family)